MVLGLTARSDETDYLIEVLEGSRAGRRFPLRGRELPYRSGAGGSISYGSTQRTKLTWYPGNPNASQQIIGRVLKPTSINGIWKDRFLGEDRSINLVEFFEELLDTGVQLRVSWSTITRQGIVKDFEWKPGATVGGLDNIAWNAVFEWNSVGTHLTRTVGKSTGSLRDGCVSAANEIGNLYQEILDLVEATKHFLGSPNAPFRATVTELDDELLALIKPLETIANAASRMGDDPSISALLLEDMSAALASAQMTGGRIAVLVSGIFPATHLDSDSLEAILLDEVRRANVIDKAFEMVEVLYNQRLRVEALIRPATFTKIPAVIGSDFRAIAIQFYGKADLWVRIANANGVEDSTIPDDLDEVIVPLSLPDSLDQGRGM